MWVFTDRGFYSVVQDSEDAEQFVVRARAKGDLTALKEFIPDMRVVVLPYSDYEYRIYVRKEAWMVVLMALTGSIDYVNFKDAVKAKQGKRRARIYGTVWAVCLDIARRKRHWRQESYL